MSGSISCYTCTSTTHLQCIRQDPTFPEKCYVCKKRYPSLIFDILTADRQAELLRKLKKKYKALKNRIEREQDIDNEEKINTERRVILKRNKKLDKIFDPETNLVFKSPNDRIVIGRLENDEFIELDEKALALALCYEHQFRYDTTLVEVEEDEVEEDEDGVSGKYA